MMAKDMHSGSQRNEQGRPVWSGPSELKGRILLADDEEPLRRAYDRALIGAGFEVESVGDGEAAIRALRERSFDAIVSDIAMPGMNGIQLLRSVRALDLDVPVVLMTGTPSVETA